MKPIYLEFTDQLINVGLTERVEQKESLLKFYSKHNIISVKLLSPDVVTEALTEFDAIVENDANWTQIQGQRINIDLSTSIVKEGDLYIRIFGSNYSFRIGYSTFGARDTAYDTLKTTVLAITDSLWCELAESKLFNLGHILSFKKSGDLQIKIAIGDNITTEVNYSDLDTRDSEFDTTKELALTTQ